MMYQFYINSVPNTDHICGWIKSKCVVESKAKTEKYGKVCYNYVFRTTSEEKANAMHLFLIDRGCSVSNITKYEVNFNK